MTRRGVRRGEQAALPTPRALIILCQVCVRVGRQSEEQRWLAWEEPHEREQHSLCSRAVYSRVDDLDAGLPQCAPICRALSSFSATAAMPLHGCFLPQRSATAGNLPLKVACSSQAQGAAAAGLLALRLGLQQPCVSKAAVSQASWCARTCRGFFRNACRNHPHCQQYPSWLCRMCVIATASSATTATTAPTALLHCHLTCCHAVPHPPCLFISSPSTMPFHFLPIHHATMPCCALPPIHYLPSHPSKSLPSRHFTPCNPLLAMLHATPPHWLQCWPSSLSPPPSPSLPSPRLFHLSPQAGRTCHPEGGSLALTASSLACSSPVFPPSLVPCSPAPSPSDIFPSASLPLAVPTPAQPLASLSLNPITTPLPPLSPPPTPLLHCPFFHCTPAPAPILLRSQCHAACYHCCHPRHRSGLLGGGKKREGVVGWHAGFTTAATLYSAPCWGTSSSVLLPAVRAAAVQTARNTVDVRGRSAEVH
ncbi:unnamed protein product [Closterium sp. NIES-54]